MGEKIFLYATIVQHPLFYTKHINKTKQTNNIQTKKKNTKRGKKL